MHIFPLKKMVPIIRTGWLFIGVLKCPYHQNEIKLNMLSDSTFLSSLYHLSHKQKKYPYQKQKHVSIFWCHRL